MSSDHENDDEPALNPREPALNPRELELDTNHDDTVGIQPHAFHLNLPPQFVYNDRTTNESGYVQQHSLPYVTQFAARKARQIVELAYSIEITDQMFDSSEKRQSVSVADDDFEPVEVDENTFDMDLDDPSARHVHPDNELVDATDESISPKLLDVHKKCSRLQAQISGLENLKSCGMDQLEICGIFLHLLRLVSATISCDKQDGNEADVSTNLFSPKVCFDNVGKIYHFSSDAMNEEHDSTKTSESEALLELDLQRDFALPSPSREALLLVLINLLSKKGPLRSVSNASVYLEADDNRKRSLMVVEWKPLLRMLLRTAPYLDERKTARCPVKTSNSRHNSVLKRTVQLCRDARQFFDQGISPPEFQQIHNTTTLIDRTALEVWEMVANDVLFHSHTHACYRGAIILYLFQPSRCSSAYYQLVLPLWWKAWTNIDRCPEYDFLWLTLYCRARKYVSPDSYDWSPIRQRLLTHCQYWLQLPIGGTSLDKTFPRVGSPRSRSCPPRLKVFAGANSSYEEGIDFVAKVAKLLVSSLGTGKMIKNENGEIAEGTNDILRFLSFVTPYFNPSNLGSWTFALGALLHYFAYELSCRLGAAEAHKRLANSHPTLFKAVRAAKPGTLCDQVPPGEIVYILDSLLPLCKQALYSKHGHVGRAGEAAMLYLIQIDPKHATPAFIDFAISALDISAVNLSHQAPAALSALTRLIQPSLRFNPAILMSRLPSILRLSLAGIDSNDQNKTIRTLVLYRSLASWIPIGGSPRDWKSLILEDDTPSGDGTLRYGKRLYDSMRVTYDDSGYRQALQELPATSLMKQDRAFSDLDDNADMTSLLIEEGASALADWSLEFLDRVFVLLRAAGEREKAGKNSSAVASRHSSADVHQARNFSRVLKECLLQLFASMDDRTHALGTSVVTRFLREETWLAASKDASLLCQAVAAARESSSTNAQGAVELSPGLNALIPVLTSGLRQLPTKTLSYRLRCLAGSVKSSSHAVLQHKDVIAGAIEFTLESEDRHLFKTGCKLLRHTLSTLTESYPLPSDCRPTTYKRCLPGKSDIILGRSAQLHGDSVKWHVPNNESVDFAWVLLKSHCVKVLDSMCSNFDLCDPNSHRSRLLNGSEINELRRCLRVIRYSLRGAASILLDKPDTPPHKDATNRKKLGDFVPYEVAMRSILSGTTPETRDGCLSLRGRICSFIVVLSSIIASDTLYPNAIMSRPPSDSYRKTIPLISSDPKVCKETIDIALLLLTRRGSSFRSQEARVIWKAQKQLAADFIMSSQVDYTAESMQAAGIDHDPRSLLYKDGEDGGKTLPRRLLVARIQLFHDSLQRHASFEVPRRLRRADHRKSSDKTSLFSAKATIDETIENLEKILNSSASHPLDGYEGIADGLYALCCHSNTEVRASAISVVDYALTRFGWMVAPRLPRLLFGLALHDKGMNGKFGVPCCIDLMDITTQQGKRKHLAEAVKGICSILSLARSIKIILQTDKMRLIFARTICGTDNLISQLPTEEMQKLVHYFQAVFSQFRSKIYYLPRISVIDCRSHKETLKYCLNALSERKISMDLGRELSETGEAHWRKLLLSCWFFMTMVDEDDLMETKTAELIWSTCCRMIETEHGQPLQRVALGLLGRLVGIAGQRKLECKLLQAKMSSLAFCKHLCDAIVFDHKEDSSVGGGHNAQWAIGVEDIMRDAARNVAPRTLFPFQRTSQALASFKSSHAQLIEAILMLLDSPSATLAAMNLFKISIEMASAPPSEDQRNQQISSAELIAGIFASFLRKSKGSYTFGWDDTLLPLFEEVVTKVPFSLTSAFFDTLRYALQFCATESFLPLTRWMVEKIRASLWQPSQQNECDTYESDSTVANASTQGSDGFTAQSKWLYLCTAIIIEIDERVARQCQWYIQQPPQMKSPVLSSLDVVDNKESWDLIYSKLLPRLLAALGHPFDSCRDHISRCLFRICYCHRKISRVQASKGFQIADCERNDINGNSHIVPQDNPGSIVVEKLTSLLSAQRYSFTDRYNALSTTRRFMSYCVHLGEAKFEYSEYVIPLLPLAFVVLKSSVENELEADGIGNSEENSSKRALEAEVIKGFRFTLAEVSVTAIISYGKESDIDRVLEVVSHSCKHATWQVRHAGIHFLRCFEGAHKFVFSSLQAIRAMQIVADLLGDDRREISSAAMAALTGILSSLSSADIARMVRKYTAVADSSAKKRTKRLTAKPSLNANVVETAVEKESEEDIIRARNQQVSVFFLCAVIMAQPYDTPPYIPIALAAISKHSFERNAPLSVREAVKRCCGEYKRTHMSDNWELHRAVFSQEQLEALEDVVSSPHYYA